MACDFSKYGKNRKEVLAEMQDKWIADESGTIDMFASEHAEIKGKCVYS